MLLALSLSAAPLSEQKAREIAAEFFSTNATRSSAVQFELAWAGDDAYKISNVQTRSTSDSALMYIYNRTDSKGFVIIAGDDSAPRPILAFSYDNDFDTKDVADGARMLLADLCAEIKDTEYSTLSTSYISTRASVGNIVCEYKTALWGQGAPFNNESPTLPEAGKAISGCVATAMSIIAYYHKWPEKGVGTTPEYTYSYHSNIENTVPANTLGRTYRYDMMLDKYEGFSYTKGQGDAVAALMYDMATAVKMKFDPEGSGASASNVSPAMINYFGYSKSALYISRKKYDSDKEWNDLIKNNLKKYGPTFFGGSNGEGGHAFVLEGYTDADYFKFNLGWNGKSNGYYLLSEKYTVNQHTVIDMYPDRDGTSTYRDYLSLKSFTSSSSGRVYKGIHTDATEYQSGNQFTAYIGVRNAGVADFSGQVGIALCDKDNKIKNVLTTRNISRSAGSSTSGYSLNIQLTPSDIASGDNLRVVYKGGYSTDWQIARRSNEETIDKVLLSVEPEEVAKSLTMEYNKEQQSLTFSSVHAIQFMMNGSTGTTVANTGVVAHTEYSVSTSSIEKGEYTLSFSSGGKPYMLKVVF